MILNRILGLFAIFAAAISLSCTQNQPSNTAQGNAPGITNTNAGNLPEKKELPPHIASLPVTMPLVDAMLLDPDFAIEVSREVSINEEELVKIRDTVRTAVLQLDGGAESDAKRSTRASESATKAAVEKIIGGERTAQFFDLIRQKWAGEGAEALAQPNTVPADSRIVINAPGYRMDVFQDGKLVKSYKVGIGYPEFPLPVGVRRAKEIIFNPTWTPPDEPWVRGKVRPGEKVEAGSKLNPLGPIKIPIGLPSLIHGGKDPSRLGTFASHGCVGLTDDLIQDFALRLAQLSSSSLTMDEVKAFEKKSKETEELDLSNEVPVELRYETILAEDGQITVFRDVYERGTNTEETLVAVLKANGLTMQDLTDPERNALLDALSQMAVDPAGDAIDPNEERSDKKPTSGKVTRAIKGAKQVVVPVAALRGKGYPKAVDANV